METQTGFDLNAAMEGWRRKLAAQPNLSCDHRRELETHLRDSISDLQRGGLNEEESFRLACRRIGRPQQLAKEFERSAGLRSAFALSRLLAIGAGAVFVASFFLPSFAVMRGWQCATIQKWLWPQALHGNWLSIHYLLLTPANLVMLASPFLLAWCSRNTRVLSWLRHVTFATVILVWSFVALLVFQKSGANLKIGCYFWSASFALLYFSTLFQTGGAVKGETA